MADQLIIFAPDDENVGLTTSDEAAYGLYEDIENDSLYFTDGSTIHEWEGNGASKQAYVWKSGQIRLKKPVNLGAAIVEAKTYTDVVFKLYAEIGSTMTLKLTKTVADGEPFRLPGGYMSNIYEIQLEGTDTVTRVSVGENILELAEG